VTIRHLVLFRLHEGVATDDPRVPEAVAGSAGLRETVPGGEDWRIGPDLSGRDVAADYAGAGDFASMATLAEFLAHPLHQAAAQRWAPIATWTVADIEWSFSHAGQHGGLP
jgi:Stress responsive A/B Barrel Domain